jgi:4-hydroxy-3-polyprenylbenzoate decarboxylase
MPDYARPAAPENGVPGAPGFGGRGPETITVAVTGASGAVFARELLRSLADESRVKTINLIVSDNALRVMAEELGINGRSKLLDQLLVEKTGKIQQQNNDDIGANVASGSYPVDAMIVIPCSMGTLARISNGTANKLIERAADVCLKEKRPLVLCVRETPLNKIHIRNMSLAADAGATIFPLIPAYYAKLENVEAMAQEFANRVLAHIGLPKPGAFRWMG